MNCTKGGVYALGALQLAALGLVILAYPPASVQVFAYVPCVSNGTLTHACGDTKSVRILLAMPCLAVSAAGAAFVSNTFSLHEAGLITDDSPFGPEALGQTGLWNALFWFLVSGAHAIVFASACSPVDVFAWALATYLTVSFLAKLCTPPEFSHDGPSAGAVTLANVNVLGYMAGVLVAFYNVPGQYTNRFVIIFLTVVLDYFLGIGHVWERAPSVETVANCRLFWACSAGLCLGALYGAWKDDFLTAPPVSVGEDR
jgi:hypothetical protein